MSGGARTCAGGPLVRHSSVKYFTILGLTHPKRTTLTFGLDMNLFQKYGGTSTVSRIVTDFYRDVLTQPHLKSYFDGVPLQRLIQHQVRFMSQVMGQVPSAYNGRAMDEAHQRLNISGTHFAEVAQILENVLRKAGMEPADLLKVMSAVASLQSSVVGQDTLKSPSAGPLATP